MRFGRAKDEPPVEEERIGTWADSGYDASDEEAHRNVRYEGSSPVKRILWIFMAQMKLFSKNKWTFILLFMAVLMPMVIIAVPDLKDAAKTICAGSTAYIGTLLCMITFINDFRACCTLNRAYFQRFSTESVGDPDFFSKYVPCLKNESDRSYRPTTF